MKAIKKSQLKRGNVYTAVQERSARFPTDSHLDDRTCCYLVKAAQSEKLTLRQRNKRAGKHGLMHQGGHAHARQVKHGLSGTRESYERY